MRLRLFWNFAGKRFRWAALFVDAIKKVCDILNIDLNEKADNRDVIALLAHLRACDMTKRSYWLCDDCESLWIADVCEILLDLLVLVCYRVLQLTVLPWLNLMNLHKLMGSIWLLKLQAQILVGHSFYF